jgi:hypothetical protein
VYRILLIFFILLPLSLNSLNLDSYKKTCEDIGYKPKTDKFADCVLELHSRDQNDTKSSNSNNTVQNDPQLDRLLEQSKKQYELQLQQYYTQKKLYDQQIKQQKLQQSLNLMKFGLGLSTGQYNYNNGYGLLSSPTPPQRKDLFCVNDCVSLGYLYGFCEKKCSY